jgi:RimJ/RimL family protein N-acetyltransferase
MHIKSEKNIYLRSLDMSDLDRVYEWQNSPDLYELFSGITYQPVSHKSVEEWLLKRITYSKSEVNMAICLIQSNDHIGNIYLRDIDWISRKGTVHLFIPNTENQGKNYGHEALRALLHYAFSTLGLNRLYLTAIASNTRAITFYQKHGFLNEGILKEHVYKNGDYLDVVIMGLCKSQYHDK